MSPPSASAASAPSASAVAGMEAGPARSTFVSPYFSLDLSRFSKEFVNSQPVKTYKFKFLDGVTAKVPQDLVDKHPDLKRLTRRAAVELGMDKSHAHTLLHFLCAGKFGLLKVPAATDAEKHADSFAASLLLYSAAKRLKLPGIAQLAMAEAEKLGEDLSFLRIISIIDREGYELGRNATELTTYVRGRAGELDHYVSENEGDRVLEGIGKGSRTIVNILLEAVIVLKLRAQDAEDEVVRLEQQIHALQDKTT
ncbi:hypothetical protein ACJ41O_009991 [Fusarium nematophilum]